MTRVSVWWDEVSVQKVAVPSNGEEAVGGEHNDWRLRGFFTKQMDRFATCGKVEVPQKWMKKNCLVLANNIFLKHHLCLTSRKIPMSCLFDPYKENSSIYYY